MDWVKWQIKQSGILIISLRRNIPVHGVAIYSLYYSKKGTTPLLVRGKFQIKFNVQTVKISIRTKTSIND